MTYADELKSQLKRLPLDTRIALRQLLDESIASEIAIDASSRVADITAEQSDGETITELILHERIYEHQAS